MNGPFVSAARRECIACWVILALGSVAAAVTYYALFPAVAGAVLSIVVLLAQWRLSVLNGVLDDEGLANGDDFHEAVRRFSPVAVWLQPVIIAFGVAAVVVGFA